MRSDIIHGSLEAEHAGEGGSTLSVTIKIVWLSLGVGGTPCGGARGYTGGGARSHDPDPELGVCKDAGPRSSLATDTPGC